MRDARERVHGDDAAVLTFDGFEVADFAARVAQHSGHQARRHGRRRLRQVAGPPESLREPRAVLCRDSAERGAHVVEDHVFGPDESRNDDFELKRVQREAALLRRPCAVWLHAGEADVGAWFHERLRRRSVLAEPFVGTGAIRVRGDDADAAGGVFDDLADGGQDRGGC